MVLVTTFATNVIASPISMVLIDERDPPLYGSLYAFRLYVAKISQSPVLRFFNGDKVAQWIEGGYQAGGNYKCGTCGVPTESFIDSAHCNQLQYWSLSEAQAHVLAGIHGGKRNCAKPFEGLPWKDVTRTSSQETEPRRRQQRSHAQTSQASRGATACTFASGGQSSWGPSGTSSLFMQSKVIL